ncbi:hypothetical protein [Wukongibacter sp. M2B1]|uniref:hypothetical protein n=1 Tax=Wukongibacter sp. M2B1 TaxID=3088895 RepID=UPI003D7B6DAC
MLNEEIFNLKIAPSNRKDKTFTKFEAYIFLMVNKSQTQEMSIYFLSQTWNWSRNKVKRFLGQLEKRDIVKNSEKSIKKDIAKSQNTNISSNIKDTKKDNKKNISKDIDLGSIQAIMNM